MPRPGRQLPPSQRGPGRRHPNPHFPNLGSFLGGAELGVRIGEPQGNKTAAVTLRARRQNYLQPENCRALLRLVFFGRRRGSFLEAQRASAFFPCWDGGQGFQDPAFHPPARLRSKRRCWGRRDPDSFSPLEMSIPCTLEQQREAGAAQSGVFHAAATSPGCVAVALCHRVGDTLGK